MPAEKPGSVDERSRLLRLRESLTAELATTQAALVEIRRLRSDRSDDDEHDPEGTPLSAEWSRLAGLHRVAEQRVADANAAIANLDAGRYGVCADCGQVLSAGRLEAMPTATRCVRCSDRRSSRR
jgi:DnaK suppressor protein